MGLLERGSTSSGCAWAATERLAALGELRTGAEATGPHRVVCLGIMEVWAMSAGVKGQVRSERADRRLLAG